MARSSAQKEQLTEEDRETARLLMKKKVHGQEQVLEKHLDELSDFKKPHKRTNRKGTIESNEHWAACQTDSPRAGCQSRKLWRS